MQEARDGTPVTGSQTGLMKWMAKATVKDLQYYKQLADDRKQALAEALQQNEELHEEVELGKTEVAMIQADMKKMESENERLVKQNEDLVEQNEMLVAENEQLQRLLESAAERGFDLI